jgi:hypothetical protein
MPRPWALITWSRSLAASWRYYATRAEAEAHAPTTGKAWTIVDVSREPSTTTYPTVDQIVHRTRRMDHIVYPGGHRDERREP